MTQGQIGIKIKELVQHLLIQSRKRKLLNLEPLLNEEIRNVKDYSGFNLYN